MATRRTARPSAAAAARSILGNGTKPEVHAEAERLAAAIGAAAGLRAGRRRPVGRTPTCRTSRPTSPLVLGGDGTVLHTARRMGDQPTPVLGINVGRLGFLADLTPAAFLERLGDLAERRFTIDNLMTLACTLTPQQRPDPRRSAA